MTEATTLALVAILGTVITALFKLLSDNTKALQAVAQSSHQVAKATNKSATEAKERNGHLGEQNVQIATLVDKQSQDIKGIRGSNHRIAEILSKSALIAAEDRDALLTPAEQHIDTQIVEKQVVKETK